MARILLLLVIGFLIYLVFRALFRRAGKKDEERPPAPTSAQGEDMVATELTFIHTADIDQAGPLAFIPAGMIKTTADGLMTMIIGSTIESMWRKVKADFPTTTD